MWFIIFGILVLALVLLTAGNVLAGVKNIENGKSCAVSFAVATGLFCFLLMILATAVVVATMITTG
jgi:hypothetical protein